jgi:hypothetical protein
MNLINYISEVIFAFSLPVQLLSGDLQYIGSNLCFNLSVSWLFWKLPCWNYTLKQNTTTPRLINYTYRINHCSCRNVVWWSSDYSMLALYGGAMIQEDRLSKPEIMATDYYTSNELKTVTSCKLTHRESWSQILHKTSWEFWEQSADNLKKWKEQEGAESCQILLGWQNRWD